MPRGGPCRALQCPRVVCVPRAIVQNLAALKCLKESSAVAALLLGLYRHLSPCPALLPQLGCLWAGAAVLLLPASVSIFNSSAEACC